MRPLLLFLPGAGPPGEQVPMLRELLRECDVDGVVYPDWRTLAQMPGGLDPIIEGIARSVAASRSPDTPIVLVGYSLGAQIGWRVASHLAGSGRPVALFVAIDGRMVTADRPDHGWVARAVRDLSASIARREFTGFLTSRFGRLLFRIARGRLPALAAGWAATGLPAPLRGSPVFASELQMRLLIAAAARLSLGSQPPPLACRALLVRTPESGERDDFWRGACPRIRICEVEAAHATIIQPPAFEKVVALIELALQESTGNAA